MTDVTDRLSAVVSVIYSVPITNCGCDTEVSQMLKHPENAKKSTQNAAGYAGRGRSSYSRTGRHSTSDVSRV